MEVRIQHQNGYKRRIISPDPSFEPKHPLFIDSATNTDCQKPMMLNAWTQTTADDFLSKSSVPLVDELQNRIRKLEELFRTHSITLNDSLAPYLSTNNKKNDQNLLNNDQTIKSDPVMKTQKKSNQTKYKIIASNVGVDCIEPIVVAYADEDGNCMDQDLNNSSDSTRLEICLPKEEDEPDDVVDVDDDEDEHEDDQPEQRWNKIHEIKRKLKNELKFEQVHPANMKNFSNNSHSNVLVIDSVTKPSRISPFPNEKLNGHESPKLESQRFSSTTNLSDIAAAATAALSAAAGVAIPQYTTSPLPTHEIQQNENYVQNISNIVVSLGPNNTRIPAHIFESMDWSSATAATRKLLITIFDREVLATHTMTGKPSPAFKGRNMPSKQQLNRNIVADIIFAVSRKCGVPEKDVRNAITTKCADENKMSKQRARKRQSLIECNKENFKNIVSR